MPRPIHRILPPIWIAAAVIPPQPLLAAHGYMMTRPLIIVLHVMVPTVGRGRNHSPIYPRICSVIRAMSLAAGHRPLSGMIRMATTRATIDATRAVVHVMAVSSRCRLRTLQRNTHRSVPLVMPVTLNVKADTMVEKTVRWSKTRIAAVAVADVIASQIANFD